MLTLINGNLDEGFGAEIGVVGHPYVIHEEIVLVSMNNFNGYLVLKQRPLYVLVHRLPSEPERVGSPQLGNLAVEHFKIVLHLPLGQGEVLPDEAPSRHHGKFSVLVGVEVARAGPLIEGQVPRVLVEVG